MQIISASIVSQAGTQAVGPGERFTLRLTVKNTNSWRAKQITAGHALISDQGTLIGGYAVSNSLVTQRISLAAGRTGTYSFELNSLPLGASGWYSEQANAFDYLRDSGLRAMTGIQVSVQLAGASEVMVSFQEISGAAAIDRRSGIAVTRLQLERCDANGGADDEGERLRVTARLQMADLTWRSGMHCRLHYADSQSVSASSPFVNLDGSIDALLSGVTDSTGLVTQTFAANRDWYFLLRFYDDNEQAAGAASVSRAFANVHLSGASTGGVAFGRFGSATEGNPLFECAYPAVFEQGFRVTWTNAAGSGVTTPAANCLGNGALRAGCIGDLVFIRGGVEAKSGDVLGSVGAALAPATGNVYHLAACGGARVARLYINTAGELHLEWVRNLSDGAEYATKVWVDCNFSYWR